MFFADAPAAARSWARSTGDPNTGQGVWAAYKCGWNPITENPAVRATEIWEFYNATADAHPMHIHEVMLPSRESAADFCR